MEGGEGEEELDGEWFWGGGAGFGGSVDGGAEADAIELLFAGEVGEDAADEGGDVIVEGERGEFVSGGVAGFRERGVEG